jgi:hypothetical protein
MYNYTAEDGVLEILFPKKIEFHIGDAFSQIIVDVKKKIQFIDLDFKETTFVTLPGALYILTACSYLTGGNKTVAIRLKNLSDQIERYLQQIKFFTSLNARNSTILDNRLIDREKKIFENKSAIKNQYSDKTIVLPISIIPRDEAGHFDSFAKTFINQFQEFFYFITKIPDYNYIDSIDDSQELFEALYENAKNVYDHSNSEGFGAVYANLNLKGTTIAFFDIGIGIGQSVLDVHPPNVSNEREAIYWALKDGNSRIKLLDQRYLGARTHNQGRGFTIIKEFVDSKKGILTIRTGSSQLNYSNHTWQEKNVGFFPGTQVIIYTPNNDYNKNRKY